MRISASFHHDSRRDNPSSDTARKTIRKISFKPTSRRSSHPRPGRHLPTGARRETKPTASCGAYAQVAQVFGTHRSGARCPPRSRSATAGTCGTAWLRPCRRKSRRTPPAGLARHRCRPASAPGEKLERWQQIHDVPGEGTSLRECARRLDLSLSTVKRYARADRPGRLQRARQYRPALAGPYRDQLRKRRAAEPGVPVLQLLREIRELGYRGSRTLLVQYIAQGRADADRPHLSPRRAARLLLTRPDSLTASQREILTGLTAACPEMTAAASLARSFATLLTPHPGNARRLQKWITAARTASLPRPHAFTRGLDLDSQAATAALTLAYHNGRTEGVNTKTKMIKRQMYGRAGFALLRHRILLGLRHKPSPPKVRQSRNRHPQA